MFFFIQSPLINGDAGCTPWNVYLFHVWDKNRGYNKIHYNQTYTQDTTQDNVQRMTTPAVDFILGIPEEMQ